MWVLKPSDHNRGNGVKVFNDWDRLLSYLLCYTQGVAFKSEKVAEQIDGRRDDYMG
jgi:hypothetical protein